MRTVYMPRHSRGLNTDAPSQARKPHIHLWWDYGLRCPVCAPGTYALYYAKHRAEEDLDLWQP